MPCIPAGFGIVIYMYYNDTRRRTPICLAARRTEIETLRIYAGRLPRQAL